MWGNICRYCQTKSHCLWKHYFVCVVKYVKHLYKGETFNVHTCITFTHKHFYKYIDALRTYQQNIRSLGLFWSAALRYTRTFRSGYERTCYPWASYQIRKIAGCACAGNAGNVFPRRRFQRKPIVSDPGMHHGTCVTHVPWCMSGSLTCVDGENVPGIPGACAPAILRIWQEAHGKGMVQIKLPGYPFY